MYAECLEQRQTSTHQAWLDWMRIETTRILFTQSRCSPHALRALDDVGELTSSFTIERLERWLSPYGRALLARGSTPKRTSWPFGQLCRGLMGRRTRVHLYVEPLDATEGEASIDVRAYYFYDRIRKPIPLRGQFARDTLRLREFHESGRPRGEFTLSSGTRGLSGEWKSLIHDRVLPVRFQP